MKHGFGKLAGSGCCWPAGCAGGRARRAARRCRRARHYGGGTDRGASIWRGLYGSTVLSDHNRKWFEGMSQLLEVDGASSHTWTSCSGQRSYPWRTGGWCAPRLPCWPWSTWRCCACSCLQPCLPPGCRRHQRSPPSGFRTLVSPANAPSQAFRNHVCPYADMKVCVVEDGSRFCTATQRLVDAGKAMVR